MGVLRNTRAAQHTMMSWRVTCVSVLLCGHTLSRPSLLGAAPGHGHGHHDHGHSHGHEGHHENHHDNHHGGQHHHEVSQSLDYNYDYDLPEQARSNTNDEYYDENPDRSYAFNFAGDTYSRDETAQADGSEKGSYSYTGEDGQQRTVNYRAGAGIGFEVIDPEVDQMFADFGQKMKASTPPLSFAPPPPVSSADTRTAVVSQPDSLYGAPPLPTYEEAPLPTYEEAPLPGYEADVLPTASVNSAQPAGMMMDPSYYFEYKSADSERVEGADIGFVVENADELAAALENVAAETPLVRAPSEQQDIVTSVPTPLSGAPPAPQPDVLYAAPAEQPEL